eukprot:SAG11_NODE_6041_length_1402_cov_3.524942_1_plen_54_part_00
MPHILALTSDLAVLTRRDHQCTLELNEVAGLLSAIDTMVLSLEPLSDDFFNVA